MTEEKYLKRAEVAELFRVAPKTITKWADAGKLPYVRTVSGWRRYPESAVMKALRGEQ